MATGYTYNLQRLSPGIYRDKLGGLATQKTLNKANNQFNTWANQLKGYQYGTKDYHDTATNLTNYAKQYGYNTKGMFDTQWKPGKWVEPATTNPNPDASQPEQQAPVQEQPAAPAAPAAPAPAPVTSEPDWTTYQSPMTKALLQAFGQGVNTMQAYEPKNFEGSPLYQFQKEKGLRDLEKLMASRGLTGSGAEIQGNSDFLADINATEAEKQRQYADQAAQRQQQAMQYIANFDQSERNALRDQWNKNLDRRDNINQFEATRDDTRKAMAINFLQNILQMQSQNNVANLSASGMNNQTDLTKALINAATQNTMAQAKRVSAGGGGTPPPPPGNNDAALYQILMNYGNQAGNNDVVNQFLNLFSGK